MSAPQWRSCWDCGAYQPTSNDGVTGVCRRYAPRPSYVEDNDSNWPSVMFDDGCADSIPQLAWQAEKLAELSPKEK